MTSLLKNIGRVLAAVALCAAVSACTSPVVASGSFPSSEYGSQSASSSSSTYAVPSIMDY